MKVSEKKLILISPAIIITLMVLSTSAAAAPPQNFEKIKIVGDTEQPVEDELNIPTGFTFAPDGRIFILEHGGIIKIFKNGELLDEPLLDISDDVNAVGERGLLGIALDPNFASNGWFYIFYTAEGGSGEDDPAGVCSSCTNKISRFTAVGDKASPSSEVVLLETDEPVSGFHQSGTVRYGPDGKLWISTGENSHSLLNPPHPQQLSSYDGKILRINPDGSIPSDNPFVGTPGAKEAVWAYGFRNPFRFNFLPNGKPIVGDVGSNAFANDKPPNQIWEEINIINKGENYGWPHQEGACNGCGYTNPVFQYDHTGPQSSKAVVGGLVYDADAFPEEYQGSYFYGDYALGEIRRLVFDGSYSNVISDHDFDNEAGTVVDFAIGPDGDLYYLTIFEGQFGNGALYKYHYSADNHSPIAAASASPESGTAPLEVEFSASGSSDPDGDDLTYEWDFDDGTTASGETVTHTYSSNGKYIAVLTVSDGDAESTKSLQIIVGGSAPEVFIDVAIPTDGHPNTPQSCSSLPDPCYNAGDTISAVGGTSDDSLPDSAFSWKVVFHHSTHIHPFIEPISGTKEISFQIPIGGETSADVWYEISLTVTDPEFGTGKKSVNIFPNKVPLTFSTEPEGLEFSLDGTLHDSTVTTMSVVGLQRSLSLDTTQSLGETDYNFDHWNLGSSQSTTPSNVILTPSVATTYEAVFLAETTPTPNDTEEPPPVLTSPQWSSQSQSSSSVQVGGSLTLSASWTDDSGLDHAILWTNETGDWEEHDSGPIDLEGTSDVSSFTWSSSSVDAGTVVGWKIYAEDENGESNETAVMTFVIQDTPPPEPQPEPQPQPQPSSGGSSGGGGGGTPIFPTPPTESESQQAQSAAPPSQNNTLVTVSNNTTQKVIINATVLTPVIPNVSEVVDNSSASGNISITEPTGPTGFFGLTEFASNPLFLGTVAMAIIGALVMAFGGSRHHSRRN